MNAASPAPQTIQDNQCYHCGLDIPAGADYQATINGQQQAMCCPGCQAVAQTIADSGLSNYYKHRTRSNQAPEFRSREIPDSIRQEMALFDLDSIQKDFVHTLDDTQREAALVIEGITCAACVWLLEHHLSKQTGISFANVNLTNHRATLRWDNTQIQLSEILQAIYRIGYKAHPYHPDKEEQLLEQEKKRAIRRLGVAGIGMMQVMMMAVALYAGDMQDMASQYTNFIRWASLLICTPVVLYASRPFFVAAKRDLMTRHLSMDVPISIAIGGAYLASVWATIIQSGEVYFDSVTMFTFFLLIGRFLEMQARHRTGRAGNSLLNLLPTSAIRLDNDQETLVPANELEVGDRVLVKPGHTIPADAVIFNGSSSVDESALTGEYLPVRRTRGDTVVGGTLNVESPLQLEVTSVGSETQLSAIVRLLERAQQEKPRSAQIADKVASYFVGAVLITAAAVSAIWWQIEPQNAFWITLSVLVVTCPCALSLATPTALTAATGTLREKGVLITRGHVLESLARASHVIFDKTGTLTEGNLSLAEVHPLHGSEDDVKQLAAALEAHSEHPVARAFHPFITQAAETVQNHVGQGIEGEYQGRRLRIGKPEFASQTLSQPLTLADAPDTHQQWLLLCDDSQPLAWFALNDQVRTGARTLIDSLHQMGIEVEMLTGDNSGAVEHVARQLNITTVTSGVTPEQKLERIRTLQAEGAELVMVGDGINDIPVLAGAQTSIAMGSATDLAKTSADAVLTNGDLLSLLDALQLARRCRDIIRQNLGWSLTYNLTALPLAAAGFVAPYMAAVGMSASSLVVVFNALRLNRTRRKMAGGK